MLNEAIIASNGKPWAYRVYFTECSECGAAIYAPADFDEEMESMMCDSCQAQSFSIPSDYDWGLNPLDL